MKGEVLEGVQKKRMRRSEVEEQFHANHSLHVVSFQQPPISLLLNMLLMSTHPKTSFPMEDRISRASRLAASTLL